MANIKAYNADQLIVLEENTVKSFRSGDQFAFDRFGDQFRIWDVMKDIQWEGDHSEVLTSSGAAAGADADAVEVYLSGLTASIGGGQTSAYDEYHFFVETDGGSPAVYSIKTDNSFTPQIPSGYALSVAVNDRGLGNRIEVDLGRLNGRTIGACSVTGDSYTQFNTCGGTLNIYADAGDGGLDHVYLTIVTGLNVMRRLVGYFRWDDTANEWVWEGTFTNMSPTITTNAANQLVFDTPSGEYLDGNIQVTTFSNFATAKLFNQTDDRVTDLNTTVDIRIRKEADGTAATDTELAEGDKIWISANAYGIGRVFIDPEEIKGTAAGTGWNCIAKLRK